MSLDLNFAPVFASSDALLAGTLVTIAVELPARAAYRRGQN